MARLVRRAGALLLLLSAIIFLAILLLAVAGAAGLDHTIEHSRRLEAEFRETARFVDAFRTCRGRMPSGDEMQPATRRGGPYVIQPGDGLYREAVAALGQPPEGGYILGLWRGEWMEYHAAWSGTSTMPTDQSAYALFGSRIRDCLIGAFGLILCLAASVKLWRDARSHRGIANDTGFR